MSDTSYGADPNSQYGSDPNSQYGSDPSGQYGSDYGQQGQAQWSFDWSQYPSLACAMQSQGNADTWLASVGVDTSQMNQAEA
jgi:hypothetical protein